ncbi:unnamed protein product [Heterobilharzia americana]|nr:unnamed protein product [Heterobilharzia americana]
MVNKENSVFSFLPTYWKSDENRSFCKREELLHELKLNVKTLMEHAAICHSVPEDSTLVLNFCELVHECLRTGLKTSPIPFYQCTSTFSLLYKISSQCEAASIVINNFEGRNKSCSKLSFNSKIAWIHFALIEDLLENIIRHICTETKEFYNSDSIIADECDVNVFLSLISGPCAISYTSAIHEDSYWSNLHADELIERQRFTSITVKSQITGRSLQVCQKMKSSICFPENYEKIEQKAKKLTRIGNSSSKSDSSFTNNSVDSLYQTRKSTLLYGKNNVMLGDEQRVPGYLELINSSSDILIRWTSNDLLLQASDMNISRSNGIEYDCDQYLLDNPLNETNTTEPMNVNKYSRINNQLVENNTAADKYYSFHFDVVTISVNKMQYVHLHQGGSFEYQIVFIGLDGIAYPPIRLQGGLKAVYDFLVCLDQGLRPSAFLNPSPTDLSGKL